MVHGIQVWTEGQEITHGVVPFAATDVIELTNIKNGTYSFPIKAAEGIAIITQSRGGTTTKIINCGYSHSVVNPAYRTWVEGNTGYITVNCDALNHSPPYSATFTVYRRRG